MDQYAFSDAHAMMVPEKHNPRPKNKDSAIRALAIL